MKIEKIVRLIAAGYSDLQIAAHMQITPVYVSMLKRTDEYQAMQVEIISGVVTQFDAGLRNVVDSGLEELREMVPTAMLALRDSLLDKANPKLRFEAAKEVLDREGTLGKISKSEIKVREQFDFSKHDKITVDLLAALQGSTDEKRQIISDSFISSGITRDAQVEMERQINLEEFEPSKDSKIN